MVEASPKSHCQHTEQWCVPLSSCVYNQLFGWERRVKCCFLTVQIQAVVDSTSSTLSNHVLIISPSLSCALFLVRCCGLCSLSEGDRFIKCCHQSFPGTPPVKGFSMLLSCRYKWPPAPILLWHICKCFAC